MFAESFKFFDPSTTKWRSFKFRKYQTFVLIELRNLSKGQLADRIFKFEKAVFTITSSSNIHFLKFWHFNFSNFQTTFVKIFTKKPPEFYIDFESADKFLPLHQYLWSEISWQWNNGSFLKLVRKSLLLLEFCQMREILKVQFCWYF